MSESDLSIELKAGTRKLGHICRVESNALTNGFPDIDFCFNGVDGHMELKYADDYKLKKEFIRPSQVKWFGKRLHAGGNCWLLLKFNLDKISGYALYRGDKLKEAAKIKRLEQLTLFADFLWEGEMVWEELTAIISIGRHFREQSKKDKEPKIILPKTNILT